MKGFVLVCFLISTASGTGITNAESIHELSQQSVRTFSKPFSVELGVNKITAFVMPGIIESSRVPPAYVSNFVFDVDEGSNILYVSPKKELVTPVSLFVVVAGSPYEFSITVTNSAEYKHQVVIGESPQEVAKRSELERVRSEYEQGRLQLQNSVEAFIRLVRNQKKIKSIQKTVLQTGPLYIRMAAQIGNQFLLSTNISSSAFSITKDTIFLPCGSTTYVLTTAKTFTVLGKEIEVRL